MRRRPDLWVIGGTAAVALLAVLGGCAKKAEDKAPEKGPGEAAAPAQPAAPEPGAEKADTAGGSTEAVGAEAEAEAAAGLSAVPATARAGGLAPLELELPKPAFIGTPKNIPPGTTVQKPTGKPRPKFLAPAGVKNVAFEKLVSASDEEPIIGEIDMVTDGDKEAKDGSYVELGPGVQWVQIDLEEPCEIFAVLFWYYHGDPRVYHDVVVQVADDPDFIAGVKTIFSNDHDNSAGLGIGKGYEYFELYEGKLVDAKGVKSQYVRVYANGSTADDMNRFTEVEVHGRPAE